MWWLQQRTGRIVGLALLLLLLQGGTIAAQRTGELPAVFDGVGIEEQLGSYVPLDVVLRNEAGEDVTVGSFFDGERPVLLNFVYHNCPMLCNLILDGFARTLKEMSWQPGQQFEVLTVSFSAEETPDLAARQKAHYLNLLGKPDVGEGWHFLTGDEAAIQALAGSVGFQFKWIEEAQEFAHPAALIFLGSNGKITRYLHGMDYPPRNVRNALVEASEGKIGTSVDKLILYCFQYDPEANSYVLHANNAMKLGGLLTLIVLTLGLFILWRRERTRLNDLELLAKR